MFLAVNKPAVLDRLLAAGADPTKMTGILLQAVSVKDIETVKKLLDADVPTEDKLDYFYIEMTTAVRDHLPEMLSLLRSGDGDPNAQGQGLAIVGTARKPTTKIPC